MSESQGNKRPATRASLSARPNKVGRPSNDRAATRDAAEYAESLIDGSVPFEKDDIDEVVGHLIKPPDDEWTQTQEDEVIEMFQSSGMQDTRDKLTDKSHPVLLGLFKVCLRVFGLTPVELISPLHGLNYQPKRSKGKGSPHIFSTPFCDALSGLIVHPSIDGSGSGLVCMLQFAVICRLDIRRPWLVPKVPKDCHVLSMLRRQMDDSRGHSLDEPVSTTHERLRNSAHENGQNCSNLSDYLNRISEVSAETYEPVSEPDDGSYTKFGAFYKPLTADDVDLVVRVINETPLEGTDLTYTVSDALKSYRDAKKGHEFPSAREFPEVWERSQKKMLRIFLQGGDTRLGRSQENETPANSHQSDAGPAVSEPEDNRSVASQDVEMSGQDGEVISPSSRTEPDSSARFDSGRLAPPSAHRVRRPPGRSSDLVSLNPVGGSSNLYPMRARESNQLSVSRAEEIDSLREEIRQLRESRAQDREIISELREQIRTQGEESAQVLHRVEKQNMEFIQKLKDENTQFIKGLEERTNLLLRLQSSNSRDTEATVNTARSASPELGISP
ncbi:hypothetical protein BKA59DRAFT_449146 [Fusarium tricinctum]|uniref:Uncharacterized protein n=1 Tax=Fusarium tricinctum TaxID=61284 RepID=A0A8K0S8U5_9HYPO|nr:hypothetical protein BKA59DRAFT_449146 [Fusarium tricinctum]